MAFKNLEERFTAKMEELYNYASTRDKGSRGDRGAQPFLEFKPNDPDRRETANDTRSIPFGSVKRDAERLGKYLISPPGLLFLGKQQLLQTGNAFTETRILNPLFVIGNVQPFKRISRVLASPRDYEVRNPLDLPRSPASDSVIGAAGRLQKSTAKAAIASATGKSGNTGLLSLLTSNRLISSFAGVFSVATGGSMGVNERPELDIDGEYYSVLLWKGFIKEQGGISQLRKAQANFRSGNFVAAVNNIRKGIGNLLKGNVTNDISVNGPPNGRNDTANDAVMAGRRYFIVDDVDADRYLKGPLPSRKAYALEGEKLSLPDGYTGSGLPDFASFAQRTTQKNQQVRIRATTTQKQTKSGLSGFLSGLKEGLLKGFTQGVSQGFTAKAGTIKAFTQQQNRQPPLNTQTVEDDVMLFPELSLKARYNEDRMQELRDALQTQKDASFAYWETKGKSKTGYIQGTITPGTDIDVDVRANTKFTVPGATGYLKDKMNLQDIFDEPQTALKTSSTTKDAIRNSIGQDLIDVMFFDFVNKKTIPFRAYISNISEAVTPEISDTRYIGRIERNVVYVGVSREVSFQLMIHAMSEAELESVWSKVNYLTGLCYPSTYASGFMVPPFIKLTVGNLYQDQPGYIKSLSHQIDDNTSWEITPGYQLPHGLTMNISYAIIEKRQMQTGSEFYPFGSIN